MWTFDQQANGDGSVQGPVGHPAGDLGPGGSGGNREVRRQRVGAVAVLAVAGQGALVSGDGGLGV